MPAPTASGVTVPLPPRAVIGILGSGQLGKMLAQAASRLGLRTAVYADESGPAFDVASAHTLGGYTDLGRLDAFARDVDVVTYEFENVPVVAARHLQQLRPVRPGPLVLEVAQDRLREKTFIRDLGIEVAPFVALLTPDAITSAEQAMAKWGGPAILKTSRFGYDGKGQVPLTDPSLISAGLDTLGRVPAVLERRLAFQCEVSVLVVRGLDGALATYDVPRNEHAGGILRRSTVPSGVSPAVEVEARAIAGRIATALGYVGVLGVEMFYMGADAPTPLVVNEIAPRVHNSGHWTMDACAVGQFENHIRAVAGWPLAATERHSDAVMVNLIGHDADDWLDIAKQPGTCLHLYGKRDARPGRKMGHYNVLTPRSCTRG